MLEGDDPGGGAFALFLRPHSGAFRQLMCPHLGEFAKFFLDANARGLAPGWGGWALLELTDALATTMRLSNHKLAIETGRYSRPFKKPAETIRPICKKKWRTNTIF